MTTIELVISPAGEVRLQTRGYAGNNCLAASRALVAELGQVASDRLTHDFYVATCHEQQITTRPRPQ